MHYVIGLHLKLAIDRFKCDNTCCFTTIIFCRFRALAYTTLNKLCTFFLYNNNIGPSGTSATPRHRYTMVIFSGGCLGAVRRQIPQPADPDRPPHIAAVIPPDENAGCTMARPYATKAFLPTI